MPRRRIDLDEVEHLNQAYKTHGSMEKAADALGIPLHKIKRAVYQAAGRCLCGRDPVEGFVSCQKCLDRSRENTKRRHNARSKEGTCRECGAELSPNSKRFCENHLEHLMEKQRRLRKRRKEEGTCQMCSQPAVEGRPHCQKHLDYASQKSAETRSKHYFGGLLDAVLQRDNHHCQICGETKPRIEVHHIRGRVNSMDNLITLCAYCHKALTFLNYCKNPEDVYAYFLDHRP